MAWGARLGFGLVLDASVSCVTDTSALKKKRPQSDPSASEAGFDPRVDAGKPPSKLTMQRDRGDAASASGLPLEPSGQRSLTLLHGVVDARVVSFCLIAGEGDDAELYPTVLPEGGLQFGSSAILFEEDIFAFSERALSIYLVASLSPLGSGERCDSILKGAGFDSPPPMALPNQPFMSERQVYPARLSSDAGREDLDASAALGAEAGALGAAEIPADSGWGRDGRGPAAPGEEGGWADAAAVAYSEPERRVVSLVRAPAGTLAQAYSYLLVPSGCIGADTFIDPAQETICGAGYSSRQTTLTPVFARLSRVSDFATVGFQLLNASPAFPNATLRSRSGSESATVFTIANEVAFGEIAPSRARTGVPAMRVGMPLSSAQLEVLVGSGRNVLSTHSWGSVLQQAGIDELHNGMTYTLVLIGPAPSTRASNWWNAPALALVSSSPSDQ